MHTLFNSPRIGSRGHQTAPDYLYIRRELERERERVISFYRSNVFTVKSDHLLVQIIGWLTMQTNVSYQEYVDNVRRHVDQISPIFRLSSSTSTGEVWFNSVFYTENISEVLMSTSEEFDVDKAVRDWKNLEPVKVLYHPFTDVTMPIPNGHYPDNRKGYAVIAINIPMLALQFRRWAEEEKYSYSDASRNTMQFVAMYPVVNMINSQLDIAMFNRLTANLRGDAVAINRSPHSFAMVDLSSKVDYFLDRVKDTLMGRSFTWPDYLAAMPAIVAPTMYEAIRLPNDYATRQNIWALTLARLPIVSTLILLDEASGSKANMGYYNRVIIGIRRIVNDNALGSVLRGKVLKTSDQLLKNMIANMQR